MLGWATTKTSLPLDFTIVLAKANAPPPLITKWMSTSSIRKHLGQIFSDMTCTIHMMQCISHSDTQPCRLSKNCLRGETGVLCHDASVTFYVKTRRSRPPIKCGGMFPHWTKRSCYNFKHNSAFSFKREGCVPALNANRARAPRFNIKCDPRQMRDPLFYCNRHP